MTVLSMTGNELQELMFRIGELLRPTCIRQCIGLLSLRARMGQDGGRAICCQVGALSCGLRQLTLSLEPSFAVGVQGEPLGTQFHLPFEILTADGAVITFSFVLHVTRCDDSKVDFASQNCEFMWRLLSMS